jgi:hypothetical protein
MRVQDQTARSDHDVESTAAWLHEVGLAGPAYLLLSGLRPLSFVGGQGLLFLEPLLPFSKWRTAAERIAGVLDDRSRVEALLASLEARLRGSRDAPNKENA